MSKTNYIYYPTYSTFHLESTFQMESTVTTEIDD